MHPLLAIGLTFSPHAMLATASSLQSQSISLETDVSLADLSSLPLSIGSARDLAQKTEQDMEVLTAVPREVPAEVPMEVPAEVQTEVPMEVPAKVDRM